MATTKYRPVRVWDQYRLRRILNRPLAPAIISGLYGMVLAGFLLWAFAGDASKLVHAAQPHTDARLAPESLSVGSVSEGYDGQFYYRMAVSPFSTAREAGGVRFDTGPYRQQRIGYPLLVRLAAGGDRDLVPWAMLGVNLMGLVALGAIGGALAHDSGRHVLLGLLFVAYPGFIYTLGLDLAEIVASTFMLGGILCLRHRQRLAAALLWSLAVLTRETTAVVPIAIALTWAWQAFRRRPGRRAPVGDLIASLIPLVVAAAWQVYLHHAWGNFGPESSSKELLGFPLAGIISQRDAFSPTSGVGLFRLLSLGLIMLMITVGLLVLRRSSAPLHEKVALVLGTVVLTVLSGAIWAGATGFMRAGTEVYLLAGLVVMSAHRLRMVWLLCLPVVVVGALTAASVVDKAH
jgi:hypothetical protein